MYTDQTQTEKGEFHSRSLHCIQTVSYRVWQCIKYSGILQQPIPLRAPPTCRPLAKPAAAALPHQQ
eukprot:3297533-Rhodomonas_salina.1